jgi:hypothetical protein
MLNLLPQQFATCEGVSRRSFLRVGTLAGLGLSLPQLIAARAAATRTPAKDVNVILVWTRGGTSHHDTFDPKPDAAANVRGEFGTIPTAVPGVRFSEVCPNMARELKRYGLLRSLDPRNGSHGTADFEMMSGHKNSRGNNIQPTYGAVVGKVKGFKNQLPPWVQLGTEVDRRFGGGQPGYLGLEHAAFEIASDPSKPDFAVRDVTPPKGVDDARQARRKNFLHTVDALQRAADDQPEAFEVLDKHQQTAFDLITSPATKKAFDINAESDGLRDRYGRNVFGQSCLLARRLVEAGVRFVTVTSGGWDTHAKNFVSLKTRLMPPVDQALPVLFEDLLQRGLLDTTLVVWLTDFGRTPKINAASGRDHWASAGFAIMAGAGVPGGSVIGKTDGEGGRPTADAYYTGDIAATIYTKIGIPLDTMFHTNDGRPMQLLPEGRVIREWM